MQLGYKHSTQLIRKSDKLENNRIKKTVNQLAIYKRGWGFEFRTAENKSSKWSEQDLNLVPPECEAIHAGHSTTLPPNICIWFYGNKLL